MFLVTGESSAHTRIQCRIILRLSSSIIHDPLWPVTLRDDVTSFGCVSYICQSRDIISSVDTGSSTWHRKIHAGICTILRILFDVVAYGQLKLVIWDYYRTQKLNFMRVNFRACHTQVRQDVGPAYIIHATDIPIIIIYMLSHYLQKHPAKVDKPNQIFSLYYIQHIIPRFLPSPLEDPIKIVVTTGS